MCDTIFSSSTKEEKNWADCPSKVVLDSATEVKIFLGNKYSDLSVNITLEKYSDLVDELFLFTLGSTKCEFSKQGGLLLMTDCRDKYRTKVLNVVSKEDTIIRYYSFPSEEHVFLTGLVVTLEKLILCEDKLFVTNQISSEEYGLIRNVAQEITITSLDKLYYQGEMSSLIYKQIDSLEIDLDNSGLQKRDLLKLGFVPTKE